MKGKTIETLVCTQIPSAHSIYNPKKKALCKWIRATLQNPPPAPNNSLHPCKQGTYRGSWNLSLREAPSLPLLTSVYLI